LAPIWRQAILSNVEAICNVEAMLTKGFLDFCDTPQKPIYAVEKSLNFIDDFPYEPCTYLPYRWYV